MERELGLLHGLLRQWLKRFAVNEIENKLELSDRTELEAQIKQLKRDNAILQEERDILKNDIDLFAGTPQMKYKMVDQHRHEYSISRLCDVFEVSRSGYYDWVGRGPSHRQQEDDQIGHRIEVIFSDHYLCYGVPHMQSALQDEGIGISRKRIARLMKQHSCCINQKKA